MSEFVSDIVTYHAVNPDPEFGVCRNTGEGDTDGVVFDGIEPVYGTFCYVGRQSILEAFALLYKVSPSQVQTFLKSTEKVKELTEQLKTLKAKCDRYDKFVKDAERAGIFITAIEG